MRLFDDPPAIVYRLKETSRRLFDFQAPSIAEIQTALGMVYTPAQPINHPRMFSGRKALLENIREKLQVPGHNLVLYGHRGVGKTSLALVALHGQRAELHTCRTHDDFISIFLSVLTALNEQFSQAERTTLKNVGYELGPGKIGKVTAKSDRSQKEAPIAEAKLDPNFLMAKLKRWNGVLRAIIIDEFQLVTDVAVQKSIVESAKILSDHGIHIPLVLVGHAESDTYIKADNYQEYKGRYFSSLAIPVMADSELDDIITQRESRYNIRFSSSAREIIIRLAAGYPTVVHSLALYACFDWLARKGKAEISKWSTLETLRYKGTVIERLNWHIDNRETYAAASRYISDYLNNHATELSWLLEEVFAKRPTPRGASESQEKIAFHQQMRFAIGYVIKSYLQSAAQLCLVPRVEEPLPKPELLSALSSLTLPSLTSRASHLVHEQIIERLSELYPYDVTVPEAVDTSKPELFSWYQR